MFGHPVESSVNRVVHNVQREKKTQDYTIRLDKIYLIILIKIINIEEFIRGVPRCEANTWICNTRQLVYIAVAHGSTMNNARCTEVQHLSLLDSLGTLAARPALCFPEAA